MGKEKHSQSELFLMVNRQGMITRDLREMRQAMARVLPRAAASTPTIYPYQQWVLFKSAVTDITVNPVIDAGQELNVVYVQDPAEVGDGNVFLFYFYLTAAAYKVRVLGATYLDRPKVDYYLDDVLVESGQDWYTAGAVVNVEKSFSLTVGAAGLHALKMVVNGKNAASSNYYLAITYIDIRRDIL